MNLEDNERIDTSMIDGKQIAEILTIAFEFCTYIEQSKSQKKEEILIYLNSLLPLLYLKGTLLQIPEQEFDYQAERHVTEQVWEDIYIELKELFKEDDSYFVWNSELKEAEEQSLSENIADIYQDAKDFILLYTTYSYHAKMTAIVMFTELFYARWGLIISSMLRHIHYLIYIKEQNKLSEYE